jgi:hypothetical protein
VLLARAAPIAAAAAAAAVTPIYIQLSPVHPARSLQCTMLLLLLLIKP